MDKQCYLTGLGASPGRRRGRARVILSVEQLEQVQPGDVLVAEFMQPELVLAFDRAAAVVTDVGGRLSHAAIVAREIGLPAVVGTGEATKRIPDGSTVSVDGAAGAVRVL